MKVEDYSLHQIYTNVHAKQSVLLTCKKIIQLIDKVYTTPEDRQNKIHLNQTQIHLTKNRKQNERKNRKQNEREREQAKHYSTTTDPMGFEAGPCHHHFK